MGGKFEPWTDAEIQVILANYEAVGAVGCVALLPGRSHRAIYQRASRMGVRSALNPATCYERNPTLRIWPRGVSDRDSAAQTRCDLALNQWPALEPANDLYWRIGA